MATFSPPTVSLRPPFASASPMVAPPAPAGTFLPGTKVQVGSHRVVIDRYLSEGGFAHVYVVHLPRPVDDQGKAVLKRVAVPDKDHLTSMRTEVETMKRLRGHKYIVKYIDSHASQLANGGYEVFLLMEYCSGGGLIDFMNTRLQNRLTEPEIVKIFTDVAEGVACMHYLKPPLLHRDLKVENVLISGSGKSKIYKLCDFGSAAPPRAAATSAAEGRLIEDDVQRHTTLQYRSPEMIDVYRKQPIDEKSDIWALGVFLYKLCYYTTPFEEVGQMAILNASFKYPGYPRFSDELKLLIAAMLREDPAKRPNIYQVLQKACKMDGRSLSIHDVYSGRSKSESRKNEMLPKSTSKPPSSAGATLLPPKAEAPQSIPDVAPMRRGRPTHPVSHHGSAKPSPSPLRMIDSTDPFASLDNSKAASGDELSSRFPTLDQFSLLTDRSKKFAFEPQQDKQPDALNPELNKRVTNALADDAFARAPSPIKGDAERPSKANAVRSTTVLEQKRSTEEHDRQTRTTMPVPASSQSTPISTTTMISPSPPKPTLNGLSDRASLSLGSGDVHSRSASLPQAQSKPRPLISTKKSGSRLANLLRDDAMRSQPFVEPQPKSPTSSRSSLEGGRPAIRDLDNSLSRSRSLNIRNRPVSVNLGARPTHIRDEVIQRSDYRSALSSDDPEMADLVAVESETNITSDVDFLKAKEEEERGRHKQHKRLSSGSRNGKRSSLPSLTLAGTKNLLAGRFGDAFRKFESDGSHRETSQSPALESTTALTPIAGSEATDLSDDRYGLDETEDLSPEMRRELEKRKLEAEERRVVAAAAEYRQRMAARGGANPGGGGAKAATIQNKVQSLLQENDRPSQKTAAGYGHFTDKPASGQPRRFDQSSMSSASQAPPSQLSSSAPTRDLYTMSAPPSAVHLPAQAIRAQRPMAPPKPKVLRTGRSDSSMQVAVPAGVNGNNPTSPDDWEASFSKKYPALSHLEMVETDIDAPDALPVRIKEV